MNSLITNMSARLAAGLNNRLMRKQQNSMLIHGLNNARHFTDKRRNNVLERYKYYSTTAKSQGSKRIKHNFNAGPSRLPPAVMERAQKELLDYKGLGIGVIEMSHRQKEFTAIATKLQEDFRKVMKVPSNFHILFEQGGATQQFTSVPLNLAGHAFNQPDGTANYLISGYWSKKAAQEGAKYVKAHQVNKWEDSGDLKAMQESVLDYESWTLDKVAKYFYFCQNESIHGIEIDQELMRKMFDRVKREVPHHIIVGDMSSSIGSRDLTKYDLWQDFGVILAGAQKNFGTSGLTFVLVRDDVLNRVRMIKERTKLPFPPLMDWSLTASQKDFFYNTPSLFSVYMSHLMCEHMLEMGGIDYYEGLADMKAKRMYGLLQESLQEVQDNQNTKYGELVDMHRVYYYSQIDERLRSRMNVPLNLASLDTSVSAHQEADLLKALDVEGFCGLKGHRSLGGLRVTLYNSIEYEHVVALCHTLKEQQEILCKPSHASAMT